MIASLSHHSSKWFFMSEKNHTKEASIILPFAMTGTCMDL